MESCLTGNMYMNVPGKFRQLLPSNFQSYLWTLLKSSDSNGMPYLWIIYPKQVRFLKKLDFEELMTASTPWTCSNQSSAWDLFGPWHHPSGQGAEARSGSSGHARQPRPSLHVLLEFSCFLQNRKSQKQFQWVWQPTLGSLVTARWHWSNPGVEQFYSHLHSSCKASHDKLHRNPKWHKIWMKPAEMNIR